MYKQDNIERVIGKLIKNTLRKKRPNNLLEIAKDITFS